MEEFKYTLRPYTKEDYDFVYDTKKVAYQKYVEANWGEWNDEKQREMFVMQFEAMRINFNLSKKDGKK